MSNIFTCDRCRLSVPMEDHEFPLHCRCGLVYYYRDDLVNETPPPIHERAFNFARHSARHVAAGFPVATEDQITSRYKICKSCPAFVDGVCNDCGCNATEASFLNKLAWADSGCPRKKWGRLDS